MDYLTLRDDYAAELRDRPEVESVALGKVGAEIVLVVLVRKDAPAKQRSLWAGKLEPFRDVNVVSREWGQARVLGSVRFPEPD